MFKFKGISSDDMQVIVEEEEHFIAKAAQRYETIEIEGKDGADFETSGYSYVERPILVQCLNINKIDDILAWLNGEGEFEYKGRKTIARFYSELEPRRVACIRIIDATFIRDPFWIKANDEFEIVKNRKDRRVTGESISLNDSSDLPYEDFKINGKSEQETRDGYNLLNVPQEFTLTKQLKEIDINLEAGVYTIKANQITSDNATSCLIRLYYEDGTENYNRLSVNDPKLEKKITKKVNRVAIYSDTDYSETLETTTTFNGLMIYKGTDDKPYEEYGVSPSPEFQSPIKSIADDINLFDEEWEGTVSKNFIPVFAGEEYIYSEQNVGTSVFYDFYETKDSEKQENAINPNKTFKAEKDGFVKIRKFTTSKIKCKLQKGSKITPYSAFGKGTVKIQQCAKNHFDISKIANVDYLTNNGDGTLTLKDNINTAGWTSSGRHLSVLCPNLRIGQRVVVSFNSTSKMSNKDNFYLSGADYFGTNGHAFTVTEKMLNSTFCLYGGYNEETLISNIQVEDEISTEYEHYQGQDVVIQTAPLRSLPNGVCDVKDKDKTIRNVKERVLDGTENWGYDTSLKVFYLTSLSSEIKHSKENNDVLIMSNYFKGDTANNCIKDDYDNCIGVNTLGSLLLKCNKFNGEINEFKAFLSEKKENCTPVTVCYGLAEPKIEEEPCEELANLHTYKNITNITTEGDIKPELDVTYIQSTNETILNTGNIESRPVMRLTKTIFDSVDLTINNVRFVYHFNNDDYVDIDCDKKTVKYEGLNRNRQIEIGYDFPKLNIGNNKIVMHSGDCIIEARRKDRWL